MNKIHRTVWSEARQCFVVASETAKARGKASSKRSAVAPAVAAALLALGGGQAFATVACGVLPGATTTVISSATDGPCTLSGGSVLSVEQSGSITGAENGVLVPGGGVTGTRVTNSGYILGSTNGVWLDPFNGVGQVDSLVNASTGTITGTSEYGLRSFGPLTKINDISNAGTIQGGLNAISIYSANMTGSVVNAATGLIAGTLTNAMGINITNGSRLVSLNNAGTVTGRTGGIAVSISQTTLSGGITNSGFINGYYGLYASGQTGGVINSGRMEGTGVANEGAGLHLDGTMTGSVINQGASAVILGGKTGLQLSSFRLISGSITNGGLIQGQAANGFGVSMTTLTGSPGFTNSGTILGATAINSDAATVLPAIQNNAGALISGKLSLLSTTTLSNNGTLSLPTATQSTMAGSYTQGSTGVFRTGVTSGSAFGKLRVSGTATLPASAQFDVVTGNASTCGGITVGTTLVGVISSATLTWDNTYAVTDDCTNINFTAVRSGQLVNLVAVAEGPSSWTVTGASGGNGSVSCVSPVVNNGYATCTGTASAGYSLSSASGCGGATVSGTTITAGPVTAACTVTGTFTRNTYAVTGASGGHGTVSCATPVAYGGTASCTGTASS